jgi:hypothetical protein
MNTTKENFEHFGFTDTIEDIGEVKDGLAHLYEGFAVDVKGPIWNVDVSVYKDDTFTMEVYRGDWQVVRIIGAPLKNIRDIIGIIEILGMKMITDGRGN